MPKSQSYTIGDSPAGVCRILVSFDFRDADTCLFGFHSAADSNFTCFLQNPYVPLGTEGTLAEQGPTQFKFFRSGKESGRLDVFADHLEIVIVAADVSRAQQLLLSKVKQHANKPRMVKYLVPADTCSQR